MHGNWVTIGCIPITDEGIKEVYWLAVLARTSGRAHIPIEIFPARLTSRELDQLVATQHSASELILFWTSLKEGFDYFERDHKPPAVKEDRG